MPSLPPPAPRSPRASSPPPEPPPEGTALLRFGATVGAGALAAALAAVPPALRVAGAIRDAGGGGASDDRARAWAAVAGALVLPMILAVATLRGARVGARAFGGPSATRRLFAVLLWTCLFTTTLVAFGAVLRATTHHHALAGATFAVVGLALGVALAAVAVRVAAIVFALRDPLRELVIAGHAVLGVAAGVVVVLQLAKAGAAPTAPLLVDGLAFAIAALLVSSPEVVRRRPLAILGPPLAAVLLMLGLSALRAGPPLDVDDRAPICAPLLRAIAAQ